MKSIVSAVALVALVAGAALARPPLDVSTSAILFDDEGGVVRGPSNQSYDFEAPAFAVGSLEPQGNWLSSGVNLPWQTVSTANPAAGTQHVRTIFDTTAAAGVLRSVRTTGTGALPIGPSSVSLDFRISHNNGADYDIIGQAPTQGFLTWRVKLYFGDLDGDFASGEILVLDDADGPGPGTGFAYFSTGIEYTPGVYANLRVEANPGADTLLYFLNNALIYTSSVGVFAGTTIEQFVFLHDNFQNTTVGESGDIDNVTIIPAPGAIALLGLGGLAAARRRRN